MKKTLILSILLLLVSCKTRYYKIKKHNYPKPVNTSNKQISYQTKKVYKIDQINVDNRFDGARMNDFEKINDTLYQILIKPENTPINPSPWFAFKIYSDTLKDIYLQLKYKNAKHRYIPKISKDRKEWKKISNLHFGPNKTSVAFPVHLDRNPQWIAAQKIINSTDVKEWIEGLRSSVFLKETGIAGKSVLNRKIPYFKIGKGTSKKKKVIVLLSRQHPPEVTGFIALQKFVNELLQDNPLTQKFYQTYEFWIFPLLNPDGVDLGHWRHNANGIDLNRDWAFFRQPETHAVANFILNEAKQNKNKIILGIDFHSTFKDVYYVFKPNVRTVLPDFQKYWTTGIDRLVFPHSTKYSPFDLEQPISKNWFNVQFKANAITYEIGDDTPEEIIQKKSKAAAINLMSLLIEMSN